MSGERERDLLAQVEALTKERDEALALLSRFRNRPCACVMTDEGDEVVKWCSVHAEVRQERDALRALLREAAEALRVLADQADETGDLPDGALLAYPAEVCLVAGDLRRAEAVLAKLEAL